MVDRIIEFLRPYIADWGYLIVGVATFLENSIGAGLVVPGETLVILGGFYASQGALSLGLVTLAASVGGILGDNAGFLIGRRFGRGLLERFGPRIRITEERVAAADRFFLRHGGKAVFLARFVPVVRSVGMFLAGASRMPWRRFVVYDVVGAALWGTGNALLGFFLGETYERYAGPVGIALVVAVVVLLAGSRWLASRRRLKRDAGR